MGTKTPETADTTDDAMLAFFQENGDRPLETPPIPIKTEPVKQYTQITPSKVADIHA